jgi:hypothetical protein
MNHRVGLGVFGTFGEPFGYQQVFFLQATFSSSLDLNANAIVVYPGSELYAVKREVVNGAPAVCCCLYTYAKEAASNRGGTFIGSCVVLNNSHLKGEAIYNLLHELHTDLTNNPKNIVDDTIQVPKAEQLIVTEPASFAAIQTKITSVPPAAGGHVPIDARRKFLILPSVANQPSKHYVTTFFEDALTYFSDTDTLYFTTNQQIAGYVTEKGLISIADWEAFQQYKIQKQQEDEASRKLQVQRRQEKPPQGKVQNLSVKIPDLYEVWAEGKPDKDTFKKMVANHNQLLQEYLQVKENQKHTLLSSNSNKTHSPKKHSSFRIKKKHLLFTIIVLFVLLVVTSCLLLFRTINPTGEVATAQTQIPVVDSLVSKETEVDTLSPLPNIELSKSEIDRLVSEKIKNKSLRGVVDIVFRKNPLTVAEVYSWQKKEYASYLLLKNKECFAKDTTDYVCTCDTLLHLPAYKK